MPIKIYLDHNIIRFLVRAFPQGVDESRERRTFERMLAQDPNVRFVISQWNIIEASRGADEARARECAALIGQLNALVIRDRSGMAREEVRWHAYRKFFGVQAPAPTMFYESYPLALWDLGVHDLAILRHTVEEDILSTFRNQHWLRPIADQENELPTALKVLQAAKHDESLTPAMLIETMRVWLLQFFPDRAPGGGPIVPAMREQMVRDMVQAGAETYGACPSLCVEDQLADFRISNKDRKPEKQDAIDLMHAVPALAYCDAFVSYDRYTCNAATVVARKSGVACFVARLPSEVADRFGV